MPAHWRGVGWMWIAEGGSMSANGNLTDNGKLSEAADLCVRQGAQWTELRRRVFELILMAKLPPTAYQLLDRLKETRRNAVPTTIYRTLDFLVEQGLIHKVEHLNAFIPCSVMGQHHSRPAQFLICARCRVVTEITDQAISAALGNAAKRMGFHPGKAIVEVRGTCASCLPHSEPQVVAFRGTGTRIS